MIAAKLANMPPGAPEGNQNASREKTKVPIDTFVLPKISLAQAAELLNVGRAVIAAKLANMRLGDNQHQKVGVSIDTPSISLEQAAELLNVGRAIIAAKLANMRQGERTDLGQICTKLSLEQAAELLNVTRLLSRNVTSG